MDEHLRTLLSNITLTNTDGPIERRCPKCNKIHRESRSLLPSRYNLKLVVTFTTPIYRDKYFDYCFSCIQTQLLLPTEESDD